MTTKVYTEQIVNCPQCGSNGAVVRVDLTSGNTKTYCNGCGFYSVGMLARARMNLAYDEQDVNYQPQ